jgi:hypothetical protein
MTWIWLCRGAMGLQLFRRLVCACRHYALFARIAATFPETILVGRSPLVFLPSQFCLPLLSRR